MQLKNVKAESMIETIIAITVIVISSSAAMSLTRTALAGNENIGERIVAMNLAKESIEAVENIRDSNYLRCVVSILYEVHPLYLAG